MNEDYGTYNQTDFLFALNLYKDKYCEKPSVKPAYARKPKLRTTPVTQERMPLEVPQPPLMASCTDLSDFMAE